METKKQSKELAKAVIKQMIALSTAGFGLVAALAWNNVIQETVTTYIKPYLAKGSGIISLLIYALIVTLLAVLITYNLTKISEKLEQ
jgi:uncharacterized membrane protein (DUF106 family)